MSYRVAAVQAEPAWLDAPKGVENTVQLIREAKANGAHLIAFPVCWIPGHPLWLSYPNKTTFDDLKERFIMNTIGYRSTEMARLREAARQSEINVILGFAERQGAQISMVQCLITQCGGIHILCREPMPEFSDCQVPELHWWPSAHSRVEKTGIGRVGVLCGHEHADPVFKRRTIQKREDLHISTWAPLFKDDPQTKAPWLQTTEASHALSRVYALESSTYVLHTTSYVSGDVCTQWGIPPDVNCLLTDARAAIYGPDGDNLTENPSGTHEKIKYANIVRRPPVPAG